MMTDILRSARMSPMDLLIVALAHYLKRLVTRCGDLEVIPPFSTGGAIVHPFRILT